MDPSSKGRLTRSKSLSRALSPHPTGAAATLSVTTPSHCTDRPWNEVTKGGSTPCDAALTPPQPDHPFESANQFTRLRSADDDTSTTGHVARQTSSRQATSPSVRTSLFPWVLTRSYSHSRLGLFSHRRPRPMLHRALLFPWVLMGLMGFYSRRRLGIFSHPRSALCPRWRTSFKRTLLGLQDDAGERGQYHGFIQYRDHHVIAADIYVRGSDGRD
jgi:hypothetical protein